VAGPKRPWGWHQLDPTWAERLVADADLPPRSIVLDIGAGEGAITAALLDTGVRVIAIEAHRGRAGKLRSRFGNQVRVVTADAADLRLPRRGFHVVANPPFALSSVLLRRLLQPGGRLLSAHLVLQNQVVNRWTCGAAPGAGRWQRDFAPQAGRRIPRSAFRPRPPVDCRVLVLKRR
jgi:23S rRNA (adenine-N6)-dimethyltransferase